MTTWNFIRSCIHIREKEKKITCMLKLSIRARRAEYLNYINYWAITAFIMDALLKGLMKCKQMENTGGKFCHSSKCPVCPKPEPSFSRRGLYLIKLGWYRVQWAQQHSKFLIHHQLVGHCTPLSLVNVDGEGLFVFDLHCLISRQ